MINLILYLLEKIPYRTKFGLSLSDLLKLWWYNNINVKKCICGGSIVIDSKVIDDGCGSWIISCEKCGECYEED
jgi:hypothetical protein